MTCLPNRDISLLALHSSLGTLASALSSTFSVAFLLRTGLDPAKVFVSLAALLGLRFVLRPVVLYAAPQIGLRRCLILGAIFCALSGPALALVDGVGPGLLMYVVVSSFGQVFYWTCYHVYFTATSEAGRRGSQVGAFQALGTLAAVLGPAAGGAMLERGGPWLTFGIAFVIALFAILPVLHIAEPQVKFECPRSAYAAAKTGAQLFFADGWMQVSLTSAWSIVLFSALHDRYDGFGSTLSLSALASASGGVILGRLIDKGHAHSVVWINASIATLVILLRAATFGNAATAITVAVFTTVFAGSYMPSWLPAVYNEAKLAPCPLRFQFAAEGGWDIGGTLAGLVAAAFCALGLTVDAVVLLALPMVPLQAFLLKSSYRRGPLVHVLNTAAR